MILVVILLIPLIFAILTYLGGNKYAKYISFAGAAAAFITCIFLKPVFLAGGMEPIVYSRSWITNPAIYFSLSLDGLSFMLVALTTFLVPLIIITTFGNGNLPFHKKIDNPRAFYALVLFMEFGLLGVFLAADAFLF